MTALRAMRLVCDCRRQCGCHRGRSNEFVDNAKDADQARGLALRYGWTSAPARGPRGGKRMQDFCRPCSQLCRADVSAP